MSGILDYFFPNRNRGGPNDVPVAQPVTGIHAVRVTPVMGDVVVATPSLFGSMNGRFRVVTGNMVVPVTSEPEQ